MTSTSRLPRLIPAPVAPVAPVARGEFETLHSRRAAAAGVGLAVWALGMPGCTFGPSDENPLVGLAAPEQSATARESDSADAAAETAAPRDTAAPVVAREPSAAAADASVAPLAPDGGDLPWLLPPAATCAPAKPPAVCDPVRNTGCPPIPLMQCDVDPAAAELTGRCAIFTPTPIVSCAATTTDQSAACLAKTACVDDRCVPLCHCDDDCPAGTTCSGDTVSGFRLCR
jgi:hypothetical protein